MGVLGTALSGGAVLVIPLVEAIDLLLIMHMDILGPTHSSFSLSGQMRKSSYVNLRKSTRGCYGDEAFSVALGSPTQ